MESLTREMFLHLEKWPREHVRDGIIDQVGIQSQWPLVQDLGLLLQAQLWSYMDMAREQLQEDLRSE
jgi:hypothetical protein